MIPNNNITLFPTNGDDYIGNESCIDLQNENDTSKSNDDHPAPGNYQAKAKIRSSKKEKRVFPPPIPLLARTQNLACHMPWVLKRYYTSEGRLILKEEKVRYHEYFRAHRENGRLTLQLVPLDDGDVDEFEEEEATSTPHEEINDDTTHDLNIIVSNDRFEDEEDKSSNVVVGDGVPVENDNVVGGGAGANGGLKCLNCSSVRSSASSCIFGVPVHSIRTVHS